ncbi:MAG: TonB-dependent receptor plug domain-containing protein [Gemmatimonadetes bacterium]|nr:TonB-dependent receptor plug domain-containing protein [Gemmatimonadota bacterium]
MRVQNRYNPAMGERISIRGFGARAQFGVRGIKILVDGIPATLPDGQTTLDHLDIGSLGRVEALRGPAAALYGNGAGGVILFESATPYAGPYSQQASVVAGSDGLLRLQATGSGTADNLAFRASIAQHQFDGYRNNPLDMGDDPYSRATRTTVNAGVTSSVGGGLLRVQLSGLDLDALNAG